MKGDTNQSTGLIIISQMPCLRSKLSVSLPHSKIPYNEGNDGNIEKFNEESYYSWVGALLWIQSDDVRT